MAPDEQLSAGPSAFVPAVGSNLTAAQALLFVGKGGRPFRLLPAEV